MEFFFSHGVHGRKFAAALTRALEQSHVPAQLALHPHSPKIAHCSPSCLFSIIISSRSPRTPCRQGRIARACCPHPRTTRPWLNQMHSQIHRPSTADHRSRFQASRPPHRRFVAVEPAPLPPAPPPPVPSNNRTSSTTSRITITMTRHPATTILVCSPPLTIDPGVPTCSERLSYQDRPRTQLEKPHPLRLLRRPKIQRQRLRSRLLPPPRIASRALPLAPPATRCPCAQQSQCEPQKRQESMWCCPPNPS